MDRSKDTPSHRFFYRGKPNFVSYKKKNGEKIPYRSCLTIKNPHVRPPLFSLVFPSMQSILKTFHTKQQPYNHTDSHPMCQSIFNTYHINQHSYNFSYGSTQYFDRSKDPPPTDFSIEGNSIPCAKETVKKYLTAHVLP